ncbi:hypothetical protein VPH35_031148 [Triticum aestivum]
MHDETTTTKTKTSIPYLPDELVSEILPRLPVESLLRFRSVCKAWRGIIDEDSFLRDHLRLQSWSLLVAPWIGENDDDGSLASSTGEVTAAGLYQWDGKQQGAATLLHAHGALRWTGAAATVHVVNPATRRTITLPPTRTPPDVGPVVNRFVPGAHAFGLGQDPRSNAYKVARFYTYLDVRAPASNYYIAKMGVFTIGTDLCWRDTAAAPPHHQVTPHRTATFFRGSLFWTVVQGDLHDAPVAPSFVRFRLEDESFGIIPVPPCTPRFNYESSRLSELRGELCVCTRAASDLGVLEMWTMCGDLDDGSNPPHWDLRRVIRGAFYFRSCMPMIATPDVVMFHFATYYLYNCDLQSPIFKFNTDLIEMKRLRYHQLGTDKFVGFKEKNIADLYVVPYLPSLVRI